MLDSLIIAFDRALHTLSGAVTPARTAPGADVPDAELRPDEVAHAAGLMRVNHTGEVCAQALYSAQALVARDPELRARFAQAARDEEDHLAWTQARLAEFGKRTSLLNPLWYAGSFAIGTIAGIAGDRINLGFVVETERQVEEHLSSHMDSLPRRRREKSRDRPADARRRGAARRDGAGSRWGAAAAARPRRDAHGGRRDARDRIPDLNGARAARDRKPAAGLRPQRLATVIRPGPFRCVLR